MNSRKPGATVDAQQISGLVAGVTSAAWGDDAAGGGLPPHYPADLERRVILWDGASVRIRPIRPEDQARLIDFHSRLSRQTAYQRFFSVVKRLPLDWARRLANVDYYRRLALVAEHEGPDGIELIGVGRYEPTDQEDTAEVAFVVQDDWQRKGLGTILFREILSAAQVRGIRRFCAWTLADNSRMLDLVRRFGDVQARTLDNGVVEVLFTPRRAPAPATHPAACNLPA